MLNCSLCSERNLKTNFNHKVYDQNQQLKPHLRKNSKNPIQLLIYPWNTDIVFLVSHFMKFSK